MKASIGFLQLLVVFVTITVPAGGLHSQRAHTADILYGEIFLVFSAQVPADTTAFRGARIELLNPASVAQGNPIVLHSTYSDSRGYYAFYGVSSGTYSLRVLRGNQVLQQLVNRRRISDRTITVAYSPVAPGSAQRICKIPDLYIPL